ncbi:MULTISPECIES: hypothetical protein [unclassified Streptomyces]|uniref:hypothetical protein n=1 Tax=unclassified Streptomyces TaxID=2593676 RepID=UPI001BE73688|nr:MULTISPECIES: hypothetical protein [unclassified Streptomyces]MBT2403678.1 hypothetical protein [Streptomyces sp. ISL-21]MBT2611265.1 hypothetical protein [Streptomyces sp. ISL-87]
MRGQRGAEARPVLAAALAGLLLHLLDDPSASVAREASLCLRPVARRLDSGWLAARIAPDRPAHTRRAAFHLLREQGGIAELRACVALAADPDPNLRELATAELRAWNWQLTLTAGKTDLRHGRLGFADLNSPPWPGRSGE